MLDLNKPVQTRDGRKARIICTDRDAARPIVALVAVAGREMATARCRDGRIHPSHSHGGDLVNVPEEPVVTTRFLNIYPHRSGPGINVFSYDSSNAACRRQDVEGCGGLALAVTYEDGKPVSVKFRD